MGLAAFAFIMFLGAVGLLVFALWRGLTRKNALDLVPKRAAALSGAASQDIQGSLTEGRREPSRAGDRSAFGYIERKLRRAGLNTDPRRFSAYMLAATAGIAVLFPLLGGVTGLLHSFGAYLLVLLFASALAIAAPLAWLSRLAAQRLAKFEAQFPSALDIFVRGLRAGYPVSSALDLLITEMPDPIGREFAIVSAEMTYGLDLRAALGNLAARVGTADVNMFVVSVGIQAETGGNLADILDGLARVIRERASMVLKVRALSSEGRMSAVVLSILPVGTFSFIFATHPKFYLDVAGDSIFLPGMGVILALYCTGMFVMNRLVQIKV